MNVENLIPNDKRTPSERRENAKKAGIASGRARREKRIICKVANECLEKEVRSFKSLKKIAESYGFKDTSSIKELMVMVCLVNTMKKGGIDELIKLTQLLGEDTRVEHLEDISAAEDDIFGL